MRFLRLVLAAAVSLSLFKQDLEAVGHVKVCFLHHFHIYQGTRSVKYEMRELAEAYW